MSGTTPGKSLNKTKFYLLKKLDMEHKARHYQVDETAPESFQPHEVRAWRAALQAIEEIKHADKGQDQESIEKFDSVLRKSLDLLHIRIKNRLRSPLWSHGYHPEYALETAHQAEREMQNVLRRFGPNSVERFATYDRRTVVAESALDGMKQGRAETFLRKLLTEGTSGIKRDNGWEAITAIFDRLHRAGLSIENLQAEYYKIPHSSNLNDGKRWTFKIPYRATGPSGHTGKGGWYVTITASFAGSAKDPSDAYDIIVNLDYSAARSM